MTDTPSLPGYPIRVTAHGGAGITRGQSRSRRYVRTSRGVMLPSSLTEDAEARREAALVGCREGAVLCGSSAAAQWRLPLPPWIALAEEPLPVSVAVGAGENRPERNDVRGLRLRLPDAHVCEHEGIRITTPARTWLDCAALVPFEYLVSMGDAALGRRLVTRDELADVIVWARGRRGVVPARRAIRLLDAGSQSPGESLVRAHLVVSGIRPPACNLDIHGDGQWIARADLAWEEECVIVEYDGAVHLSEASRRSDAARRNLLQQAGWLVIVLTARDLRQPWVMCQLVREALTSRRGSGR